MNFIERIRKRDEERLQELNDKYYIPKRFKSAEKISGNDRKRLKSYEKIYDEMQYQFPKKTGELLETLFLDDNYMLAINRISEFYGTKFKNGVKSSGTEFTSHFNVYPYFPDILSEIKRCNNYKNATGCIIAQIPKDNQKPIWFKADNEYYLLPEYIVGFIPVKDGICRDIILNPNYRKEHDYEHEGLEYDETLYNPEKFTANTRKCK